MKKSLYLICLLLVFLEACQKEDVHPQWDVNLLTPIAKTHLTLDQIVADSLMQVNGDSSISLVYQTQLADIKLDTLVQLPDTSIDYSAKLNSINISPINIEHEVTIGAIARLDKELNGPFGGLYEALMNAHNGGAATNLAPIAPMVFDSIDIDAGGYYQTIWLEHAYIDISIVNGMPIALSDISLSLKNQGNGQIILTDSFTYVAPGSTVLKTKYLSNIMLEDLMTGSVVVSSPGGTNIIIDTSMFATAKITVRDIVIDSAIARFPSQQIIDFHDEALIPTTGDLQVSEAWARSGMINVDIYNTIEESMHYQFELPGAKLNGQPLQLSGVIPAASGGNASHSSVSQDLTGYKIDFSGMNQDTVNKLYYILTGSIDSSGNFIKLTMNDSLTVHCSISNIVPDYARGFFGIQNVEQDSVVSFSVLNSLQIDELDFNDVRVSLTVENQVGAQAQGNIIELTSINSAHNTSVTLAGSALSSPFSILKPIDPHSLFTDVVPTINTFNLNSSNSNISQLVSNMPDAFRYHVALQLNQGVTPPSPGTGTDFIYYGDKVSSHLNVEIPLSFIAGNLVLRDTVVPNFAGTDVSNVNGGDIILMSSNMYPIDAAVQVYFLNEQGMTYDSLTYNPLMIQAASMNLVTQRVTQPRNTKNVIPVTPAKLSNFIAAKKLIISARFNTQPPHTHVKIYSEYYIDFKIIGDFSYRIEK